MMGLFDEWGRATAEARLSEEELAESIALSQRKRAAERRVDERLGIPTHNRIDVFCALAILVGLPTGIVPWAVATLFLLWLLATGSPAGTVLTAGLLLTALPCLLAHLLIGYGLRLVESYYGVPDRSLRFWNLLGLIGLLVAWQKTMRSAAAKSFRATRREMIERELAVQSQ